MQFATSKAGGALVPGSNGQGPFRFAAKKAFLTFAGLHPAEVSDLAAVWGMIHSKLAGHVHYVLCSEVHKQPADPARNMHIHVLISTDVRIDTLNWRFFDLVVNGRRLHPGISIMGATFGDYVNVAKYIMKDGRFIAHLPDDVMASILGSNAQASGGGGGGWAHQLRQQVTPEAGMNYLLENDPARYYEKGTRIMPMLQYQHKRPTGAVRFPLSTFDQTSPVVRMDVGAATAAGKTIILHGATSTGKTALAKAILHAMPSSIVHVVQTRDGLKKQPRGTTAIIFDDMDFANWTPGEMLNLLCPDDDCEIRCRNSDATINAGVHRIMTTNRSMVAQDTLLPRPENAAQGAALNRRIQLVAVTAPLFR